MSPRQCHLIFLTLAIIIIEFFIFDLSSKISTIHSNEKSYNPFSSNKIDPNCIEKVSLGKNSENPADSKIKKELKNYIQEVETLSEEKNATDAKILVLKDQIHKQKSKMNQNVMKIAVPTGIVEDDFKEGKSCRRSGDEWHCRDCGKYLKDNDIWQSCPLIDPHGECEYWEPGAYDEPLSRIQTYHDKNALHDSLHHAISRHGHPQVHEYYPCFQLDDCFDMDKCVNLTSPLKVFIYDENMGIEESILRELEGSLEGVIERSSPENACLFVVTPRFFDQNSKSNLFSSSHWDEGRNHFVYQSNGIEFHNQHFDGINFQKASLGGQVFQRSDIRVGYDMPLFFNRKKDPLVVNGKIYHLVNRDLHRNRKYLLTYQGVIMPTSLFYFHGWLASEYWPRDDPEILIDVECQEKNATVNRLKHYLENIINSTFVFCPGNHFAGSQAFGEALALGAIPVVTTEFAEPFYPEMDWSGCLVKVNEGRIIDLPRILQSMTRDSIIRRQRTCMDLFQLLVGWNSLNDGRKQLELEGRGFAAAMRFWKLRIEFYFKRKKRQRHFIEDS